MVSVLGCTIKIVTAKIKPDCPMILVNFTWQLKESLQNTADTNNNKQPVNNQCNNSSHGITKTTAELVYDNM